MKTLILYATKNGATHEIAKGIAKNIDGSEIHDLKKGDMPNIAGFDCIIIGSSLYVGSIRKEAKAFLSQNAGRLQGKKLGLFVSGLDEKQEKTYFDKNFPQELQQAAKEMRFLGGIFDPQKAGTMERLVIKVVAKQSEYINTISDEQIKQFAEAMKA